MGLGNLTDRSSGQTILEEFFNSIHDAMEGDFVGRNTSGVPTSGQSLGTAALPWGALYAGSLIVGGSSVDVSQVSAPPFRVVSGAKRSTSNQPAFLDPAGAAGGASFTLLATTTNFVYDVNGVTNTISADIVKGSLTVAPNTNNTALVNDTDAADQEATRTWGEKYGERTITIDTIGSEISSLDGKIAAFNIYDGTNDEYFIALVDTTNNQLKNCYRGFFYDSSGNPINRIKFANNDTITLMSLGWVFVDDDGTTIDVTYREPIWSTTSPSSPATGDYWYDMANSLWKRYDGATFQTVDRVWVGYVVLDDTDCVAARCADFDARYHPDNSVILESQSTEIVRGGFKSKINVAGNELDYTHRKPLWNITTDLAGSADMYNATEQASTNYHFYIADDGEEIMSDISPYWRADLYGWYHPHNPWRWVGSQYNDSSSDLLGIPYYENKHVIRLADIPQTRVTGSAPVNIGEYRSYRRNASATTYIETSADPATVPNADDGFLLYGGEPWATIDPVNNPSMYDLQIGKGHKRVEVRFWSTTGRTGHVSIDCNVTGTASTGVRMHYDETTGIIRIARFISSTATTNQFCGRSVDASTNHDDVYYDVLIYPEEPR